MELKHLEIWYGQGPVVNQDRNEVDSKARNFQNLRFLLHASEENTLHL